MLRPQPRTNERNAAEVHAEVLRQRAREAASAPAETIELARSFQDAQRLTRIDIDQLTAKWRRR
jgi:hypothetical protein